MKVDVVLRGHFKIGGRHLDKHQGHQPTRGSSGSEAGSWPPPRPTHLEDVVSTLAAEVVLTWQDDHRFGEHLQTDGADELLLQTLHDDDRKPLKRRNRGKEEEQTGAGRPRKAHGKVSVCF